MFSHDQYQALHGGAGLLDRRTRGRLQLTGPDRRTYLQGLLTNDIAALAPGTGCYAALLTPQGRMLSDMRVSEIGDRVLVDLPEATAESVRQRLTDFIFTEDVEVRDLGGDWRQMGLYGPLAAALLASVLTSPVAAAELQSMPLDANREYTFRAAAVVVIKSDDYGVAGFETFVPASNAEGWLDALRSLGAVDVEPAVVDVTRVEAGRPEFGPDMDEHTIPLEAGIEGRAISLTKGCYVGQEVIVRVLHRGQGRVAKRLVGLVASDDRPLFHGMRLEADGKPIGSITSAVLSPRVGRAIALGYVHRDLAEAGRTVFADGADGPRQLRVVSVPFAPTTPE